MNTRKIQPTISIGMPVYNGEKFICKALDTLLNQSFTDFELIISDNASTDSTKDICLSYAAKDSRIKYLRQDKNKGAIANFMFVLNQALGEYFMWAAADDYWSDNWLEVLLGGFTFDTSISFGHVVIVSEDESIKNKCVFRHFSNTRWIQMLQLFFSEENNYKANYIYGMYKRSNLLKYRFGDIYGADNHFVFEIIQHGKLSTNQNTFLFKRFVTTSEGNTAKQAYSSRFRKILLLDYFPYYAAYPKITISPLLKIILFILLPIKYFKSIIFTYHRYFLTKIKY